MRRAIPLHRGSSSLLNNPSRVQPHIRSHVGIVTPSSSYSPLWRSSQSFCAGGGSSFRPVYARTYATSRVDSEKSVFKKGSIPSSDVEPVAEDDQHTAKKYLEYDLLDAAPPSDDVYTETSFNHISAASFDKEVSSKLTSPVDEEDVEIKPDGLIYLPEIFYRRRLNDAFGPGGWALMPRGTPQKESGRSHEFVTREYALFCFGQFVSQASGEQLVSDVMGPATAVESVRSQAMTRCCKDLGIASELWDVKYINSWKSKHAIQVWAEHHVSKSKRQLWRRKDRPPLEYPWKEQQQGSFSSTSSSSSYASQSSPGSLNPNAPFDPKSVVPSQMKKMAGKSWDEVLNSADGRQYVEWVAQTWEQDGVRQVAERALKYIADKEA